MADKGSYFVNPPANLPAPIATLKVFPEWRAWEKFPTTCPNCNSIEVGTKEIEVDGGNLRAAQLECKICFSVGATEAY